MTTDKKKLTKTRVGLIFIATLFLLSPILAWMFYSGVIDLNFQAGQGKNRGELIHPARPLGEIILQDSKGGNIGEDNFLGQWSLLEIAPAPCVEACSRNIYRMRQIRLALGKDAHRVQRIVMSADLSESDKVISDNPGTLLFRITDGSRAMLKQFPGYSDGGISAISGRIYIIDPLANLMMQYPHEADPSAVLKDLRHLLKATWIRPRTE